LRLLRDIEERKTHLVPRHLEESERELNEEEVRGGDVLVIGGDDVERIHSAHDGDVDAHNEEGLEDGESHGEERSTESRAIDHHRGEGEQGHGEGGGGRGGNGATVKMVALQSPKSEEEDGDDSNPGEEQEGGGERTREVGSCPHPPVKVCVGG
jgi:hypothetical protein